MGYPMRSGYRGAASRATSGLSNEGGMVIPLPANDIKMGADLISPFVRIHPALRFGLDLYRLYSAYQQLAKFRGGFSLDAGADQISGSGNRLDAHDSGTGAPQIGVPTYINPNLLGSYSNNRSAHITAWSIIDPNGPQGTNLAAMVSHYKPSVGVPGNRLFPAGMLMPMVRPRWSPWFNPFDPWNLPIQYPATDIPPAPWPGIPHKPDPWSDPSPVPKPKPKPDPDPLPKPKPDPDPKPKPDPDPDPVPKPRPRPRPDADPLSNRYQRPRPRPAAMRVTSSRPGSRDHLRPPTKGIREVKLQGRAASGVWTLANLVTESRDFIDALWSALPKHAKTVKKKGAKVGSKFSGRSGPTVQQMLKDLYNYMPEVANPYKVNGKDISVNQKGVDYWNKAIDNFVANQIQDYVFGKLGKAVGEQSRKAGRPVGYAAGPAL